MLIMNEHQVVFILVIHKNICFLVSDQVNHIPYFIGSEHDGYMKMNHNWIKGYKMTPSIHGTSFYQV